MPEQQAQSKKRKKRDQSLQEVTIGVLRGEVERLESKLRAAERNLAEKENEHLSLERRANSAEAQVEAMFDSIRILAASIPPDTAVGRKARQEARVKLEALNITPPSSLGSSRNRPRRRS